MPAQKTPSFASPAHARFAKVFSFAGCSRLLVLSYTVRDAKGVIRWRALIFPPGHPALALALFYQIWPCPCKCPNGHKNGICGCFYPKSAISCRDCPTNPPKSLCTPPTKSYKFVSANPCETDAGRINKYDYPGCVGGSFWNFIRFRDFPETVRDAKASHFERLPRPGEVARKCQKGARWHGEAVTERARMLTKSKKHSDTSPVCQSHRIAVLSCFISPGLPSQALARQLSQRESPWQRGFVFDETDLRLPENVTGCQSLP